MSTVTIPNDEEFLSRLRSLDGPAELCTENGTVVGQFVPPVSAQAELRADGCPYPDEEISRMLAQPDGAGRSLKAILQDLQSR